MVTQEILKEAITYFPDTGEVVRNLLVENSPSHKMYNSRFAGKSPTTKDSKGYLVMRLQGKTYRVARLIWLYMTGEWPDQVDHINRVRDDNRWSNLRNVDNQTNCLNRGKYNKGSTTSEYPGVSLHRATGKWRAQIAVGGKKEHIGLFDTEQEAGEAYLLRHRQLIKGHVYNGK